MASKAELNISDEATVDDFWSDADDEAMANLDVYIIDQEAKSCQCQKKASLSSSFSMECDRLFKERRDDSHQFLQRYHSVTDFARQHWCEQQLLYNIDPEIYLFRVPAGTEVNLEESKEVTEIKAKGSGIHLTRELEISTPVEVTIETVEDKWAVRILNLWSAVSTFLSGGQIAREVPVFAEPFGLGAFVFGIIDELRYDMNTHTVTIAELKTRKSRFPPKSSQQEKDRYQVSLYAHLFNELVQGKVTKESISSHLRINLFQPFGLGVMEHIQSTFKESESAKLNNLSSLLDQVLCQIQCLTCITCASIEYLHQESKVQIETSQFDLDAEQFHIQFLNQLAWWEGKRETQGVDIEDTWKCTFCPYQDWCEWREVKAKQLANKAEQQQGKDQVSNIIKDEPEKKAEIGILEDKDVHKKSVT